MTKRIEISTGSGGLTRRGFGKGALALGTAAAVGFPQHQSAPRTGSSVVISYGGELQEAAPLGSATRWKRAHPGLKVRLVASESAGHRRPDSRRPAGTVPTTRCRTGSRPTLIAMNDGYIQQRGRFEALEPRQRLPRVPREDERLSACPPPSPSSASPTTRRW